MIEAGAPSTDELSLNFRGCARPTGGSHGRTTEGPAQRFKVAKAKGRAKEGIQKSAAKDSIKAGVP
jgi:hypothetical protein